MDKEKYESLRYELHSFIAGGRDEHDDFQKALDVYDDFQDRQQKEKLREVIKSCPIDSDLYTAELGISEEIAKNCLEALEKIRLWKREQLKLLDK